MKSPEVVELLKQHHPCAGTFSVRRDRSGQMVITSKEEISGTMRSYLEGILVGRGLAPMYYGDYGPCGGVVPFISWRVRGKK